MIANRTPGYCDETWPEEVEAGFTGHVEVRDHQIKPGVFKEISRLRRAFGKLEINPFRLQEITYQEAKVIFIVDYQHSAHGFILLFVQGRASQPPWGTEAIIPKKIILKIIGQVCTFYWTLVQWGYFVEPTSPRNTQ